MKQMNKLLFIWMNTNFLVGKLHSHSYLTEIPEHARAHANTQITHRYVFVPRKLEHVWKNINESAT
jgi:hypothetical protein